MKGILILIVLLFAFSCAESENTKPQEIKYKVELLKCNGEVFETYNATDIYFYSSGETRITLINGIIIDYKGKIKSTILK